MTVYLPCLAAPVAVRASASPPACTVLWRRRTGGGPPIVAAGLVWTIGQDGVLYGSRPGHRGGPGAGARSGRPPTTSPPHR